MRFPVGCEVCVGGGEVVEILKIADDLVVQFRRCNIHSGVEVAF